MKRDIKSNFSITENVNLGTFASGANNGTAVDMSDGLSAAFVCMMVADGTNGSIVFKLQHSADGTTDWTDEVAGALNDTAVTLSDDSVMSQLNVVNPRRRYYRVVATSDVADATGGVVAVLGPLNSIKPA
jgi:hypothetical protein